jgi:hypothetical protein
LGFNGFLCLAVRFFFGFVFVLFWFYTPLNSGAEAIFYWLFVMKITIQRDNDVLLSGFLLANVASAELGGQPEVVK